MVASPALMPSGTPAKWSVTAPENCVPTIVAMSGRQRRRSDRLCDLERRSRGGYSLSELAGSDGGQVGRGKGRGAVFVRGQDGEGLQSPSDFHGRLVTLGRVAGHHALQDRVEA